MSEVPAVQRRRSILIGVGALAALLLLAMWLYVLLRFVRSRLAPAQSSQPAAEIGLCDAQPTELCIISFGREGAGKGLVIIHVPGPDFPDFYMKIVRGDTESGYECARVQAVSNLVTCTGDEILLGEVIEVRIHSKDDDRLLAIGQLTVPFLAIAAPAGRTPTPTATGSAAAPTPRRTATPIRSYPNPTPSPGP